MSLEPIWGAGIIPSRCLSFLQSSSFQRAERAITSSRDFDFSWASCVERGFLSPPWLIPCDRLVFRAAYIPVVWMILCMAVSRPVQRVSSLLFPFQESDKSTEPKGAHLFESTWHKSQQTYVYQGLVNIHVWQHNLNDHIEQAVCIISGGRVLSIRRSDVWCKIHPELEYMLPDL